MLRNAIFTKIFFPTGEKNVCCRNVTKLRNISRNFALDSVEKGCAVCSCLVAGGSPCCSAAIRGDRGPGPAALPVLSLPYPSPGGQDRPTQQTESTVNLKYFNLGSGLLGDLILDPNK